ncbi:hypothetical protein ACRE_007000 [Hapsidospora chrysogenum ATCC 11550]|uniref:Uncharacterized protein n=1 Tax=Hapsidospora chrysogenum (strain ATCC 11550 / CBS 779.69 / DSM 880 / IAM 14645 / JCM 23072 / IMI 49137) TaxID=857340 RepID=A0A086TGA1_HAPC1|nr:hypothetical protein ACRE_007000 [Hapsidospora chrysogenum ATCC 11550]
MRRTKPAFEWVDPDRTQPKKSWAGTCASLALGPTETTLSSLLRDLKRQGEQQQALLLCAAWPFVCRPP